MQKLISAILALFAGFAILKSEAVAEEAIKVGYAIQAHQANMMVLPKFAEKYGLKVDLVAMRRFPDLQLALTTHQIDAAVLGYVNIALLEENNTKNYKVISGVYVAPGSLVLAADVDSQVKTWKDLEGKSLGTAPNGAIDIVFSRHSEAAERRSVESEDGEFRRARSAAIAGSQKPRYRRVHRLGTQQRRCGRWETGSVQSSGSCGQSDQRDSGNSRRG